MTSTSDSSAEQAAASGPMLAADGTPLKKSIARALRMQKLRALALIAPLLIFAPDGIYTVMRRFSGFFNIPIIAVVLMGFFNGRIDALPAKIVLLLHVIAYDAPHADAVQAAWEALSTELKADTILYLTTTEGEDEYVY